jgi:cell division protein FtsQ
MAKSKKKPEKPAEEDHSWRGLEQHVANPRHLTTHGRKRLALGLMQTALYAMMVGGCLWGGYEVLTTLTDQAGGLYDPAQASPLREVVVVNDADGVLDQEWVEKTIAVRKGTPLMEVDINQMRNRLLATPQVKAVDIRRDFPGTLTVTMRERLPIARINAKGANGAQILLVARDGVVFDGQGYDKSRLSLLPYLDGVRLVRNRFGGFLPIGGMEDVAHLMQSAQNNAPLLYSEWKVISLSRLANYDELVVKSRAIPEIVLSRRIDFTQQLARLDYIADYARTQPEAVVQRVDLSLGSDVPVAFENTAPRLLPASTVKPSTSRIRRDL